MGENTMPNRDRTGPAGQGPLTGRGLGPCGCGFRRGFGRGFGRFAGNSSFQDQLVLTKDQERKILEAELAEIDAEKTEIEKQLKEIK